MTRVAMTVSELAAHVGSSSDTIRYYDRIGLMADVTRDSVGHRRFDGDDVARLRFIQRAKHFGLTLDQIRELLDVRDRGLCACGHTRELLHERRADIAAQIEELRDLEHDIDALLAGQAPTDAAATWPCAGSPLIQIQTPPRTRETKTKTGT